MSKLLTKHEIMKKKLEITKDSVILDGFCHLRKRYNDASTQLLKRQREIDDQSEQDVDGGRGMRKIESSNIHEEPLAQADISLITPTVKKKSKSERTPLSDLTNVGAVAPNPVTATQPPSITDIQGWSTEQLIQHLQGEFLDELDNDDLEILRKRKIRGRAFLMMTEEKFMADGMERGPAVIIAGYIEELKDEHLSKRARTIGLRGLLEEPPLVQKRQKVDAVGDLVMKKQRTTYPEESEEGRDGLMVIGGERLKIVDDYMTAHPIGLLRSPPYSGKSTICVALRDYFAALNHDAILVDLSAMAKTKACYDEDHFEKFWESKAGRTWTEISCSTTSTIVIIDEAQVIYGESCGFFWGRLKELLSSSGRNPKLRVLLVATYDPSTSNSITPIQFTDALGLQCLRLTDSAFRRLVEIFVDRRHNSGNDRFNIPESISSAIFTFSSGHAGLCRFTLSKIYTIFRNGGMPADMLRYLASSEYLAAIKTTRAFRWVHNWDPTDEQAAFLRNVLYQCDSKSSFNVDIWDPNARPFFKSGLFTTALTQGQAQFAAPIMQIVLCHRLFAASGGPNQMTFEEFLLRTIERMRPSILRQSLGRGSGSQSHLHEVTWQMEWYRTAVTAAPIGAAVSPNVGATFGAEGFLDFYVDGGLCWGFEMLREGNRMAEHARRFEVDGRYNAIPLKEWAVIDFRHELKRVSSLRDHFWYALYTDDYTHVTIQRRGHDDVVLPLRGDMVGSL